MTGEASTTRATGATPLPRAGDINQGFARRKVVGSLVSLKQGRHGWLGSTFTLTHSVNEKEHTHVRNQNRDVKEHLARCI